MNLDALDIAIFQRFRKNHADSVSASRKALEQEDREMEGVQKLIASKQGLEKTCDALLVSHDSAVYALYEALKELSDATGVPFDKLKDDFYSRRRSRLAKQIAQSKIAEGKIGPKTLEHDFIKNTVWFNPDA